MPSSLEIAQRATLRPIEEIAAQAGLQPDEVEPYGRTKAKIDLGVLERLRDRPDGKLICVTAITPTKALEDRKSTRLNSSHLVISYAVFCLKKKKQRRAPANPIPT